MQRASGIARRTTPVACSACGRTKAEVSHMIAGTQVYICDACVHQAARQLSARQAPPEGVRCRFCRRRRAQDTVTVAGTLTVCAECLGRMEMILAEASPDLDPPHSERRS